YKSVVGPWRTLVQSSVASLQLSPQACDMVEVGALSSVPSPTAISRIEAAVASPSAASLAARAAVRMMRSAGTPLRSLSAMAPTAPNSPYVKASSGLERGREICDHAMRRAAAQNVQNAHAERFIAAIRLSRVIGNWRTRTPRASHTALAIAAVTGPCAA